MEVTKNSYDEAKMNIFINDTKIDYKPLFPLSWAQFFQKLLQDGNYVKKDHGIVRVVLDGVESLEVMTEHSNSMVDDTIQTVQVFTKDSVSIANTGFDKVILLIESIKAELSSAADLYRQGNIKDASTKIARVMEALKPMINFINSVGISFTMNFDHIMFNPTTSLRQKIESFLNTFTELIVAQEKRDFVEVADYLEYQLIEDMSDWATVVALLKKEVEAGVSTNA